MIYEIVGILETNMLFSYDSKQRMRECFQYYHSTTEYDFESWRKYGYSSKNQAIIYTIYLMGMINGNGLT